MKSNAKSLSEARDRFRVLLADPDAPESRWQALFSDCPAIFSSSLPVRIHEDDIRPLARLGKAEPDFLFFPRKPSPLSSLGVIELKRPDTRLIRIPRHNVLSLSTDAADAIAQAKKYALEFESQVITRPDELLVIGNEVHVFVIAGMSTEIAAKVTNEILRVQFAGLLPANCRIVPFDTLLASFESRFPPVVHVVNTWLPQSHATLARFLSEIEAEYGRYAGYALSDDGYDSWANLEKEFVWLLGPDASYEQAIPPRSSLEIDGSAPGNDGRRPLATEAPNPSMFAIHVSRFVRGVLDRTKRIGLESTLPIDLKRLRERTGAYASD